MGASANDPPQSPSTPLHTAYGTFNNCVSAAACKELYTAANAAQFGDDTSKYLERTPTVVTVGGRVVAVRDMGKVVFITIRSDGELLQLGCAVEIPPTNGKDGVSPFCASKEELQRKVTHAISVGDIVGASGILGRTKKGEVSVFVQDLRVLAPYACTDMTVCPDQRQYSRSADGATKASAVPPPLQLDKQLSKSQLKKLLKRQAKEGAASSSGESPKSEVGVAAEEGKPQQSTASSPSPPTVDAVGPSHPSSSVSDPDLKYRYRFVDMLTNPATIQTMKMRHRAISSLRRFLDNMHFTEVETPVFQQVPSGANAKPFTTHHSSNNADLFLRIAPELHLKQCVVGGLERVYEIGKVFRNEDTDRSHNPEFTSCEFYAAYHTYIDLMGITESILRQIAQDAIHTTTIVLPSGQQIDLSKPFRRVAVIPEIEKKSGVQFPSVEELDTPFGVAFMGTLMIKHNIPLPTIRTAAKLLDKLVDHFITDDCMEPVFVCDHPIFMSPLAKAHEDQGPITLDPFPANTAKEELPADHYYRRYGRMGLSERFELFIAGMEVCNSYSELTDPKEQMLRFEHQMAMKAINGDEEAMELDETFLKALQVGLPPTAGWGMGIDRLVMLLGGHNSIRDVILFPLLKADLDQRGYSKRRTKTANYFGFNQGMTMFCLSSLESELRRRGDRKGCEQVQRVKAVVQTCARDREQWRQELLNELEGVFEKQRLSRLALHGEEAGTITSGGAPASTHTSTAPDSSYFPPLLSGLWKSDKFDDALTNIAPHGDVVTTTTTTTVTTTTTTQKVVTCNDPISCLWRLVYDLLCRSSAARK